MIRCLYCDDVKCEEKEVMLMCNGAWGKGIASVCPQCNQIYSDSSQMNVILKFYRERKGDSD